MNCARPEQIPCQPMDLAAPFPPFLFFSLNASNCYCCAKRCGFITYTHQIDTFSTQINRMPLNDAMYLWMRSSTWGQDYFYSYAFAGTEKMHVVQTHNLIRIYLYEQNSTHRKTGSLFHSNNVISENCIMCELRHNDPHGIFHEFSTDLHFCAFSSITSAPLLFIARPAATIYWQKQCRWCSIPLFLAYSSSVSRNVLLYVLDDVSDIQKQAYCRHTYWWPWETLFARKSWEFSEFDGKPNM